MKTILLALSILTAFLGRGRSGGEPILRADPYIFYENGTYYLYGTYSENGIAVMVSKDLKTWETPGGSDEWLALDKKDCYGEKWFWAPEVYKVGGRYVMFHSAEEHVCMAVADSPLGPFKGDGKPIVEEQGIDNYLFIDDDGTPYMFWVRFDNGNVIWMAQLTEDLRHPVPGTERFVLRPELPWETHITEGPFCIKHKGTYYLTYSGDDYRSQDYAIGYATAESLDGEWTKFDGNPIFCKPDGLVGTGHHSFFKDSRGRNRIVFHSHFSDTEVGPRRTLISRFKFKKAKAGAQDRLVISPDWQPLVTAEGH
ncbi:MAG: glycoside hydrolase family 43 protein [Bacteroidales bacterium]|nr:glycoside hydrolase family 43 protein [Bacteroidales bacterium]